MDGSMLRSATKKLYVHKPRKMGNSFSPFFLFLRGSVCVVDSIFSLSDERVLPVRRVLTDMRSERRNEHTQKDERIKTC